MTKMGKSLKDKTILNFNNTAVAFAYKSNEELKHSAFLFKMMNKAWFVRFSSAVGLKALQMNLPFVETTVEATLYKQFCSGTTLLNSQDAIDKLYEYKVQSVLDYGAEAKTEEKDFNHSMNEAIRAIEFASETPSISTICIKLTALAPFKLLEKIQSVDPLSTEETKNYKNVLKRIDSICYAAHLKDVRVFIDAEESWIQDTIDFIANRMMKRYNKEKVIVLNTFQLYRKNRLDFLIESFDKAQKDGYILGAKLVRGAYMEKERNHAEQFNTPSPIHDTKQATDNDYNTALQFCVDNYTNLVAVAATHNKESCLLLTQLMEQKNIDKNHPNLSFCQLYGMGDNISFNLAAAGYTVSKYMVYGPVKEVMPFLIRRAEENSAVAGDMGREYQLIRKELKRRGLR